MKSLMEVNMCWFYYATVLTFYSMYPVILLAQDCSPAGGLSFYEITSIPTLNPFTNNCSSTQGPGCFVNPSTSVWECFPSNPLPVLIDGQLGEVQSPPSVSAIHAWRRSQQQTVTITFRYSSSTQVRHIRLYFYHVPSMGIGLPDIAITAAGTSQSYHVTGNQDLSSTDAQRRMVVLSFTNTLVISNIYEIQFTFGTSSKLDWLLLSEVEMCTSPNTVLTPTVAPALVPNVPVVRSSDSDNLTLSCTVSGEGMFSWEWSGPQSPEKVWFSDFTRTSTAEFTGIKGPTSVDTGYSCRATYDPTIAGRNFNMYVSQNLDIFLLDFSISTTTANVMVPIGGIVSLSCEVFGYLPGSIPAFMWFDKNNTIPLNNGSIYSITNIEGSRSLQNSGLSSVPNIVSQLSFVVNTFLQNEPFVCLFQERLLVLLVSTTSLTSVETDDITATLSSQTTSTLSSQTTAKELANKSSSVIFIATIPTVIIILIALVAIACTVIVVFYVINRRRKQSSLSDEIYDLPLDIDVETVTMNKSVAYGVVTEAQETMEMSLSNTYEL